MHRTQAATRQQSLGPGLPDPTPQPPAALMPRTAAPLYTPRGTVQLGPRALTRSAWGLAAIERNKP
jgi:hypothetical protein